MSVWQKKIPVIPFLVVIIIVAIFVGKGIKELFPGEVVTYDVAVAKEVLTVENRLWHIIPLGSEHYYLTGPDEENVNGMLVRADESWYNENFDAEGRAVRAVTVKGIRGKSSSSVKNRAAELNSDLSKYLVSVNGSDYVNTLYKRFAVVEVIIGALIAVIPLIMFITYRLVVNGVIVKGGRAVHLLVITAIALGVVLIVLSVYLFSFS